MFLLRFVYTNTLSNNLTGPLYHKYRRSSNIGVCACIPTGRKYALICEEALINRIIPVCTAKD